MSPLIRGSKAGFAMPKEPTFTFEQVVTSPGLILNSGFYIFLSWRLRKTSLSLEALQNENNLCQDNYYWFFATWNSIMMASDILSNRWFCFQLSCDTNISLWTLWGVQPNYIYWIYGLGAENIINHFQIKG